MRIKLKERENIYRSSRGSIDLETFESPTGRVKRAVIHHPGAVGIIAQPEPGQLLLVRQYRYPLRAWTLEIPAGTCDPGEPPQETARRELEEEGGYRAAYLEPILSFYPGPGGSDELISLFLAKDLSPCEIDPDPGELIEPVLFSEEELRGMMQRGEIQDAKTWIALSWLFNEQGSLFS